MTYIFALFTIFITSSPRIELLWLLGRCCVSGPSSLPDNIQVMVIDWRLRGNVIRTALCWIVWHNVHSQQHTYISSSYRSNRLDLSHWDSYAMHRGGCLELYYCNLVEWFWWDSSLISTTKWFNRLKMTYNVLSGTLSNQPTNQPAVSAQCRACLWNLINWLPQSNA